MKIFKYLIPLNLLLLLNFSNIDPIVKIEGTTINGNYNNGVYSFLGVPFALPPIGELRWQPPKPLNYRVNSEINAKEFKSACMQNNRIVNWYKRLVRDFGSNPSIFESPEFSEDCLYLNIWKPAISDQNLPVLVYIHGGSNKAGWSYEPNYHGDQIVKKDVVLVSIPYRLGVFGFFPHPDNQNPNLALLDQILALQWINKNISNFNGDPKNITIIGESSGAGSINHLLVSPKSKGLFQKAIHQSGGSTLSYPTDKTYETTLAIRFAEFLEEKFKIDNSIESFKGLSSRDILDASEIVYKDHYYNYIDDGITINEPVIDTIKNGKIHNIDLIIGSNNDEYSLYFGGIADVDGWLNAEVNNKQKKELIKLLSNIEDPIRKLDLLITAKNFVCPSLLIAKTVNLSGGNSWVYQFNRVRDDPRALKYGAFHGAELPYVFNTHDEWLPTNEIDRKITEQVQSFWVQFSKTGDPNLQELEEKMWDPYNSQTNSTYIINEKSYSAPHPSYQICDIMEPSW